jgi:TolB-like protein/tRNA A-37 threonylcarbamoyl transferase component Bud32
VAEPQDRLTEALAGRYAIERELGRGGMATVFLAEDAKHHRKVAVKVLHPDLAQALGADRFLREIEIAASLRHPHILPLYDSGEAGGYLYYVMPYVEGDSLRTRLARERQLPIDDALRISREVADALSYAHARGVVHRDIKPENILLEAGHAVVADFGIAKAVATAGQATALTATGMSVGTPSYMSPEQSAGDPDLDGRSDLYSLGCVLYEMLAGQPPFSGATVESVVRQHVLSPPPPVTQFRPAVPASVADAVARALAKNPADRFNPVGQFAAALSEAPAPAPAPGEPAVPRKRQVGRIAVAGLLVITVAAAAWTLLRSDRPASDASIAVLPFTPLGDTARTLAVGMHAEIITQLTKTPGLRVASRSSSLGYGGSDKGEADIAAELGVTTLLTGSVQQAGDQVRFSLALSDPIEGRQIWAESYDRRLTAENLLDMQAEVAREVAAAMQLQLSPAQEAELARPQTTDLAALNLYYRALPLWDIRFPDTDTITVRLLEEAVGRDSAFAAAWGLLAQARSWLLRTGTSVDTLPARIAVERVRALAPGSLDARIARGYYLYYAHAEFEAALDEFDAVDRIVPNHSEVILARALLLRRLGRWDESIALELRATELDPRNTRIAVDLADGYRFMRRYADAERAFDRTLALAPTSTRAIIDKFGLLHALLGDTARAQRFAAEAQGVAPPAINALMRARILAFRRDSAGVLSALDEVARLGFTTQQAPTQVIRMLMTDVTRNRAAAHAVADGVLRAADSVAAIRAGRGPRDPFATRSVADMFGALALASRGDSAAAIARAERAALSFPIERDAIEGPSLQRWLAAVYARTGRHRESIAILRRLLAMPSNLGWGELRFDPLWDPLRGNAEFEALIRGLPTI